MRRRLVLILAALAIFVGIIAFYGQTAMSTRTGAGSPLYSTRRYDPYGTAAMRDLLIERGISVRTLEGPNLHPDDHGVLIEVLGLQGERIRPQQLLEWISKGNTVVQYTRAYTDLMGAMKIEATTRPLESEFNDIEQFQRDGVPPDQASFDSITAQLILSRDRQLTMWQPMWLKLPATNPFWQTLARTNDRRKAIVAGQLRIGRGKLIIIGAPDPALNGLLGSANNLDFLLSIVGNSPVLLDEWSHGLGKEPTIIGLIHDVGLLPLLFQLAGVVALYVWSTAGFARRDQGSFSRRRSSVEQIQTLGYLYERSYSPDLTRSRVASEVRNRLSAAFRCSPEDLGRMTSQAKGNLRERFSNLLTQLDSLRDDKALARVLTESYEIQREVQLGRHTI